jgi:hypothetical protein
MEDLSVGIAPMSGVDRAGFTCQLIPEDNEFEKDLISGLPNDYGDNNTLSEAVTDFISYVGKHLAYNGICIFEIVASTDDLFKAHFGSPWTLVSIPPEDVVIFHNWLVQSVRGEAKGNRIIPLVLIPRHKCAVFTMPDEFGGKRGYKRLLLKLSSTNQMEESTAMMHSLRMGQSNYYDFSMHQKVLEIQRWKLSRLFGWHHRSYLDSKDVGTEYFRWRRLLEFRRTQLIIRHHILETLKKVVSRVGLKLGREVSLDIKVPRKVSDLDEALKLWEQGGLEFDDVNEYLR